MKINSIQKKVKQQRTRRIKRVRFPLLAKRNLPRLSVSRSNKHIYAQIIDDMARKTLVASSDLKIKDKKSKLEKAMLVGKDIALAAAKKKITKVVFDRGWYKFHGRVKALAEGARSAGLKF